MKSIIFALFILPAITFSQSFVLTEKGMEPVVIQIDSMAAKDMYKKAIAWVQENYKSPTDVLKSNIENEMIRVHGMKLKAFKISMVGSIDMEYYFQVDFKDGKLRATYEPEQLWHGSNKMGYGYPSFFKSNGEVKGMYEDSKIGIEKDADELAASLVEYIKTKKADW